MTFVLNYFIDGKFVKFSSKAFLLIPKMKGSCFSNKLVGIIYVSDIIHDIIKKCKFI